MLLFPKNTKFNKSHRKHNTLSLSKNQVFFMGDFGLIASESGYITSQQIESLRIFLRRKFKKCARI
jgi:ribosomal protein L16/L10AE